LKINQHGVVALVTLIIRVVAMVIGVVTIGNLGSTSKVLIEIIIIQMKLYFNSRENTASETTGSGGGIRKKCARC